MYSLWLSTSYIKLIIKLKNNVEHLFDWNDKNILQLKSQHVSFTSTFYIDILASMVGYLSETCIVVQDIVGIVGPSRVDIV